MKGSKLGIRLLYYFGGFFVMTIGIALSVKSNLGVSPVSSIPYTMTCVWVLRWVLRPSFSTLFWSSCKCC